MGCVLVGLVGSRVFVGDSVGIWGFAVSWR